jgi:hypothetical protein
MPTENCVCNTFDDHEQVGQSQMKFHSSLFGAYLD